MVWFHLYNSEERGKNVEIENRWVVTGGLTPGGLKKCWGVMEMF